jgi:hypothetical protein
MYRSGPGLEVWARGFTQGFSLHSSDFVVSDYHKQVELLASKHKTASFLGNMAGWATPGGLGRTVTDFIVKAAEPIAAPVRNFLANRIGGRLGAFTSGAANRAIISGSTAYGTGAISGTVESWAQGDSFLEGFYSGHRRGWGSVGPAAVAGGITGGFEGLWRHRQQVIEQGNWIRVNESMSQASRNYQTQITDQTGQAFQLNGVKFDGVCPSGRLVEVKGSYSGFINPITGEFQVWFTGGRSLVNQANRQLQAAKGTPIDWYFSDRASMYAVQELLESHNIKGINYIFQAFR